MKECIWEAAFPVSSFLVSATKKLSLPGLICLMQEMAWSHADHLGYGYASTRASGGSWVIARQRIEVDRWPDWGDQVTVRTWLRPPGSVIVIRDFEFLVSGRKVGQAAAHWLTINHQTRRPVRLPFSEDPRQFRQDTHLDFEPEVLKEEGVFEKLATYVVRYSDLDMNSHVNNVRFAQWVLDSQKLEFHLSQTMKEYQINFLAEAGPGDPITVAGLESGHHLAFEGRRGDQTLLFKARVSF